MTPCRLRKKSRNSLRAIRIQLNRQTTHARPNINKLARVEERSSKTEIQYLSDKLEATCSFTNDCSVINPDAPPEVRQGAVETPIDHRIKTNSEIDEGGDRLPDHKAPGDRKASDDDSFKILLKKIEHARKSNSAPTQKNSCRHFDLAELPKFELPIAESKPPITDLLNVSKTSFETDFEKNKRESLMIDFTQAEFDKESSTKCADFWNYLDTRDDLKHLQEYPKEDLKLDNGELMTDEQKIVMNKAYNEVLKKQSEELNYPAVDRILEHNKTINKSLKSKRLSSRSSFASDSKLDEAKSLCVEMDEFDKKHPKSFENPGPVLSVATYSASAK